MDTATNKLLRKLIAKQAELGESDGQFAARLDVSRQLWAMTRSNDTPLGMKVLAGVFRAFPSLNDDVLKALAEYNLRLPAVVISISA